MAKTTADHRDDTPPRHARRRAFVLTKRLARSRDGAMAVEFAFVAVPFFALLFAIIETALVFWTSQALETAVSDASRRIYTGQFQAANPAASDTEMRDAFRQSICDRIVALFNCQDGLLIDVRAFNDFADVALAPVVDGDGGVDPDAFGFEASAEREVVIVRAAVEYPVFVTLWGASRGDLANGRRLIMATAAFRNEPFGN